MSRCKRPALLLSLAAAFLAAGPNTASAASAGGCEPLPTTQAFKGVDGDLASYAPAPGGGFEYGAPGWTLTGAARTAFGNETLGVRSGVRSLRLPLGSTATSPEFCVDRTKPHFRFAFKADNAWLTGFEALVIYRDAAGKVADVELTSSERVTMHPTFWQASENSPLATLLPLDDARGIATVQIKFVSLLPSKVLDGLLGSLYGDNDWRSRLLLAQAVYEQIGAAVSSPFYNVGVSIDSVMVDPYRRG